MYMQWQVILIAFVYLIHLPIYILTHGTWDLNRYLDIHTSSSTLSSIDAYGWYHHSPVFVCPCISEWCIHLCTYISVIVIAYCTMHMHRQHIHMCIASFLAHIMPKRAHPFVLYVEPCYWDDFVWFTYTKLLLGFDTRELSLLACRKWESGLHCIKFSKWSFKVWAIKEQPL